MDLVTDEPGGVVRGMDVVEELKASGALDELFAKIDSGEIEMTGDRYAVLSFFYDPDSGQPPILTHVLYEDDVGFP